MVLISPMVESLDIIALQTVFKNMGVNTTSISSPRDESLDIITLKAVLKVIRN